VYNWYMFGIGPSNCIDCGELANAEGCDNSRDTFDSGIPICCITCIDDSQYPGFWIERRCRNSTAHQH
jgi:hypothetical protein